MMTTSTRILLCRSKYHATRCRIAFSPFHRSLSFIKGTRSRSSQLHPIPCPFNALPRAVSTDSPQTAAAPTVARHRQEEEERVDIEATSGAQAISEEEEEEEAQAEHRRPVMPSTARNTQSPGEVEVELHRNDRRLDDEEVDIPLHSGEKEEEGGGEKLVPSPSLVGLLVLFFFLYVGIEVGFGAWVAVVVLRDELAGEAGAALMASVFWGGITVGRLLAVPLAVRFSADSLVRVNLFGGLLSSALLWFFGRGGIVWAAAGAGLFGLFMASTYPLAMSLLPSAGYVLSDKNSSRFVVGGALGEMLVPAFIALILGGEASGDAVDDNDVGGGGENVGRPGALYDACVAVSALLVVVYGTWFRLLSSSATTAAVSTTS